MQTSNKTSRTDSMRSKLIPLLLLAAVVCGCSKSEALDANEQKYVKLSVALMNARSTAKDSATVKRGLDSVYRVFQSDSGTYHKQTDAFVSTPDRASMVFRAINDSLHGR